MARGLERDLYKCGIFMDVSSIEILLFKGGGREVFI